jgi:nucleoside-diphosphate-sugar epimerase
VAKSVAQRLFVFGLGYVGLSFALALKAAGWEVAGTCRSECRKLELAELGLEAFVFDGEAGEPEIRRRVVSSNAILLSVPPGEAGDPVLKVYGTEFRNVPHSCWFGYLSTTGVYGDWGGREVDETAELRATSERGSRRIIAESSWFEIASKSGSQSHVFRLAGIYGPGRNVLDKIRSGTARRIRKSGHVFSRIHLADIVAVLSASILRPRTGAVYNVCDNEPCSQDRVVAYGCEILGETLPPMVCFEDVVGDMSAIARSFWFDRRLVSNRLIREELKVNLQFPTYREGLKSLLNEITRVPI